MLKKLSRFFTSPLIKTWGKGEIPESLKYDRKVDLSTLPNGVRVASQFWEGRVATVGIMIEAGSRNETLLNSGVAHYLEHMHFKGTPKRTKEDLEEDVENMGGSLNAFTSRDSTLFYIEVLKESCSYALDVISDILLNSDYLEEYIAQEQHTILREAEEVGKDMRETLLEDVHFGAFRDHIIGQPILGTTATIKSINRDKLKKFINTHYIGPRIVVLGAGSIEHEQLLKMTVEFFGKVPATSDFPQDGEHSAVYNPSIVQTRDEKAECFSLSIFSPAPPWTDPEYWAFLLMQRIMSDYSEVKKIKIDNPEIQSNRLNSALDSVKGIKKHECLYIPYKDVGLFGHYVSCDFKSGPEVCERILETFEDYSENLTEYEIIRGKNKVYNELLGIELGSDIVQTMGAQLIYMQRIIPRSEIAKRVSEINAEGLRKILKKWFVPNSYSVSLRGPLEYLDKSLHRISQ